MAADPITGAEDLINTVVSRIWPDKTESEKAELAQALAIMQGGWDLQKAQIAANAAEATQPGLHFRDGAGWVCVVGLAVTLLKPVIEWGCALIGHPITLPAVDTTTNDTILYSLLGLGGMHAAPTVLGVVSGVGKK